jgi:hypothetical protein
MCKTVRRAFLLVSAITSTAIASEAIAAQRTFVSGAGSDANPCSLSQPCRSLGAAIALVSAGGEVVVLDSAGYGPVTISQSVSITAPSGVYAGITSSGGSGISISGSNLHVTLRGLTVNSLGGTDGIDVFTDNSEVRIERCTMHGFTHEGLRMAGVNLHVHVEDSEVSANQIGVFAQDGALVHLERVSITENSGAGLGRQQRGRGRRARQRDRQERHGHRCDRVREQPDAQAVGRPDRCGRQRPGRHLDRQRFCGVQRLRDRHTLDGRKQRIVRR